MTDETADQAHRVTIGQAFTDEHWTAECSCGWRLSGIPTTEDAYGAADAHRIGSGGGS